MRLASRRAFELVAALQMPTADHEILDLKYCFMTSRAHAEIPPSVRVQHHLGLWPHGQQAQQG